MERLLALDGTFNCRDLGGYRTEDGLRIKWGRLYRSDALHKLTDRDHSELKRLGIKTVIDFRAPQEIAGSPNRLPDGVRQVVLAPMAELAMAASSSGGMDTGLRIEKLEGLAATEEGRAWLQKNTDSMGGQMREFVSEPSGIQAFGAFLRVLAEPDSAPLIFHCRGGKDRTGWAAALILSVLGVPRADIMDDYLATARYNAARNEKRLNEYRQVTSNPLVLEFMSGLMQVKADYLNAAFDELERMGGIQTYVTETLGITQAEQARLLEQYLD